MTTAYAWGRQSFAVSPQVVGESVEHIVKRDGHCAPSELVKVARKKTSPLHPYFTWDDSKAADKWRNQEARNIINSLVVVQRVGDEEQRTTAFVSVGHTTKTMGDGEGYRSFSVIAQHPEWRDEAMAEALSYLQSFQRRYGELKDLAPVWRAIEQVKAA